MRRPAEALDERNGAPVPGDAQVEPFVLFDVRPQRGPGAALAPTRLGPGAVLRSHTVIYAGNVIGARFQTGHGVLVRESNSIGDDVSIGSHSIVEHHVTIANGVRIHGAVFIPEFTVLEECVWIGPNVVLTNARYPASPSTKANLRGPHLHARAKVGAGAVLLPGVTIGAGALVGAGAVVVKDVPAYQVVVGNPARSVGDVRARPEYVERLDS
jgi:acetyltransferase-like isoleucine patch superfamily enzyme